MGERRSFQGRRIPCVSGFELKPFGLLSAGARPRPEEDPRNPEEVSKGESRLQGSRQGIALSAITV